METQQFSIQSLTWNTRAQCDEHDGRHRVLNAQRAAKVRRHVANDRRHDTNAQDRHHKA